MAASKTIKVGAVTYKSLAHAAKANNVPYMTMYMRLREGWTPAQAVVRKVRPYRKGSDTVTVEATA